MPTETKPVSIDHVRIRRIRSIESLDIPLGKATIIAGGNGVGKSNALKAVLANLTGDSDPNLVLDHDGIGTVHLVAEDGRLLQLTATAEDGKVTTKRKVTGPGGKGNEGVDWVKANSRAKMINPGLLMSCDDKTRYEEFAAAVPIQLTPADLAAALEVPADDIELTRPPLDEIKAHRKRIFDRRTDVNSDVRSAEATIEQIERTLPEGSDSIDYAAAVEQADAALGRTRADYLHEKEQAGIRKSKAIADAMTARDEARAVLDKKYQEHCARIDAERDAALQLADRTYNGDINEVGETWDPILQDRTEAVSAARAAAEQAARVDEQRQIVQRMKDEAKVRAEEAASLTRTITRLDKLKAQLIDEIPVPGLSFEDGAALIDGLPWECANTARRVEILVQVAAMGAGPLGIVVFDNLESLDPKTFEHVMQVASKVPAVKFLGARVMFDADGNPLPLTVIDCNDLTLGQLAMGVYKLPAPSLNGSH